MKQGYGVFGAAYEVMLRNDPHDPRSIDHELLRRMVRLDPESYDLLYAEPPFCPHMEGHDLYGLAQTLKKQEDRASIETILAFTSGIAKKCETSLEKKRFGEQNRRSWPAVQTGARTWPAWRSFFWDVSVFLPEFSISLIQKGHTMDIRRWRLFTMENMGRRIPSMGTPFMMGAHWMHIH